MDEVVDGVGTSAENLPPGSFSEDAYDVGAWAAGYEARSAWLVKSDFKPVDVGAWYRVEYTEGRTSHSAKANLEVKLGTLLGDEPAKGGWDGEWRRRWEQMLRLEADRVGRPLRIFADYSSMPRTVYGPLVLACHHSPQLVESLTMAYVPGIHAANVDGSRTIEGLRALAGTEGRASSGMTPAFVIGLGYDGVLAEAILELFQVGSFACMYADPGVSDEAVERATQVNRLVLERAELVRTAPAWDAPEAARVVRYLCGWYAGRDVVVVPLGPKPHILGSLLAHMQDDAIALRFARTQSSQDVQVTVEADAKPFGTRISFGDVP